MKEERMKVLEMLQDGKITAEDAMKLLDALGYTAEEPQGEGRQRRRNGNRQRQRRRRRTGGADIQVEVQERIREAQETLREAMPKARRAVREAMPDVNRIVREATRSIPDVGKIVQEAMQTASEAFSQWAEDGDRRYPEKAVRQQVDTTPIQVSDRLSVRTPKGHVISKIWDRDEVKIDAKISVWGTDEAAVKAFAEQIDIQIQRESDAVQIRPNVPKREKDDPVRSVRIDFELRHPKKVDLDVRARHGNITLPKIDGAAILNNHHGKTIFEGASGNIRVKQHHGDIAVQHAGGDLSIDARHSDTSIDAVSGSATVKTHHGDFVCRSIERNAEINIHHGRLEGDHIGGNVVVDVRHGPVAIREIGGDFAVKAGHSPIEVDRAGGNVQAKNNLAPITVREIGGDFIAENNLNSIKADRIGGRAVVKNNRGTTHLENIAGATTVHTGRGAVEIENPESSVMIKSRGSKIAVRPHKPIGDDYAIQNKDGAVDLIIPDGSAVDVHGYVGRGRIQTDLPLSITGVSRTSQVVTGQLNGGGTKVAVELGRGDLSLHSDEERDAPETPTPPEPPDPPELKK